MDTGGIAPAWLMMNLAMNDSMITIAKIELVF